MSAFSLVVPNVLKLPYLLLTFAFTDGSMQDCEVFTDRFETSQACYLRAEELQITPASSLLIPEKYEDTLVTYCTFNPDEGPRPDVLNFIIPRK